MVTTIPDQDGGAGLKVIHVALFRMATRSVAEAYRILGYKVHHGLDVDTLNIPWGKIEEAAEATWPEVPGAKPRPRFTRQDWNELWGNEVCELKWTVPRLSIADWTSSMILRPT